MACAHVPQVCPEDQVKVKVAQLCLTVAIPWTIQYMEFPSQNTGVGCRRSLL